MAELTKQEELERVKKSIELAQNRLAVINQRLSVLEREIEELVLRNEIHGYKGRTIEKTEAEINSLQKEKATLQRTVEVLKKKLPGLEKAARIELASTETITEYEEAKSALKDCLESCPGIVGLQKETETIESYMQNLADKKERYLALGKQLNKVLLSEELTSLNDITIEKLKADRDEINYQAILSFSDGLIDLSERLNQLQYDLFVLSTSVGLEYYIQDPPLPHANEICNCNLHRREFIPGENSWHMWEYKQSAIYFDKWTWTLIHRDGGFDRKPEFPCEIKNTTEFPKTELIEVAKEKESRTVVGQMIYGNENKQVEDPDKAFNQ